MATQFVVDQAASFKRAHLVQVDPRLAFGTDKQDTTKDGVPVWQAQIMITQTQFDRDVNEIVRVTIVSPVDPAEGIPPFAPVRLHNLSANVYDASRKNGDTGQREVTGAGVSFRCDRIEAAIQDMRANGRKPEPANA
jgi:hypothetical protein